jgi:hypothetical protein
VSPEARKDRLLGGATLDRGRQSCQDLVKMPRGRPTAFALPSDPERRPALTCKALLAPKSSEEAKNENRNQLL